ncbi:MAG: hypothetical protein E7379_03370 [Clostridiales bacterium]|nr:hypothetical protein [Clostridiales bacterium]
MANVIRNMNFKPILEKITYQRLSEPEQNSNVNVQVWDEMEVKRLRSDAVKVELQRNIKPDPSCLFTVEARIGVEVIVNTSEFDALDDAVEFFKTSPVTRVLVNNLVTILANLTTHSQLGPIITAPMCQFPK